MRKTSIKLFIFALIIGITLMFASNRLSAKIESMLRDDAVAVLGLAVDVDQVDLKLANGQAKITGLEVANLEGFPSENVFDMSHVEVDISMLSMIPAMLGLSPYRLETIRIDSPVVSVDIDQDGQSNLELILEKIRQSQQAANKANEGTPLPRQAADTDKAESNEQAGPSPEHHQARRFKVDQLTIEGLSFNLRRAGKEDQTGTLAPINMQDLGGEKGATVGGLGLKVSSRLASDILAAVLIEKAADKLGARLLKELDRSKK